MKAIKYFAVSGIFAAIVGLSGCGGTVDPSEAYPKETQQQIFQNGEQAIRDHSYQEAIKRFEALDVQYPFGPNTEKSQLHIIYAYYKNSDYASAEAAADRYIRIHPTSPHVDYAYYMRGLSNFYQNQGVFERMFMVDYATRDLTQVKKSFNDFSTIVHQYPHSYYAPAAHQWMIYLRDVLARHQLEVARYYYDRGAYVASANRAALVVKDYEGSPRVPEALMVMAKSYQHLNEPELENETINVIQYNYPNYPYLQQISGDKELPPSDRIIPPAPIDSYAEEPPVSAHVSHASHAYAMEDGSEQSNVFAQPNAYPQNGDRTQGHAMTLGDVFHSFGNTTKGLVPFVSPAPVKPNAQAQSVLARNTTTRTDSTQAEVNQVEANHQDAANQAEDATQAAAQAAEQQSGAAQQKLQEKSIPYNQNGDR